MTLGCDMFAAIAYVDGSEGETNQLRNQTVRGSPNDLRDLRKTFSSDSASVQPRLLFCFFVGMARLVRKVCQKLLVLTEQARNLGQ